LVRVLLLRVLLQVLVLVEVGLVGERRPRAALDGAQRDALFVLERGLLGGERLGREERRRAVARRVARGGGGDELDR